MSIKYSRTFDAASGDSYWVPTSRDVYPDMRLSRLPQVDYVVSKQSWVGRLLQRPNFELTQLMFFVNRLKQPGGQAFLSSDPAPLGANLLNWTDAASELGHTTHDTTCLEQACRYRPSNPGGGVLP